VAEQDHRVMAQVAAQVLGDLDAVAGQQAERPLVAARPAVTPQRLSDAAAIPLDDGEVLLPGLEHRGERDHGHAGPLFLLSALEPTEARAALRQLAAENDAVLATLREQVDKFDAAADPGTAPPLNRLVAEFGLRSYQTLREWAQWALDNIGEPDAAPE
jgi:Virulence activator alpha C-term